MDLRQWPVPSKEDAIALTVWWANYYGNDVERTLRVVNCESGFNAAAKNKTSSASGLYQFISSTWTSTLTKMGMPEFSNHSEFALNAELNAQAGAWLVKNGGWGHWICK